MSAADSRGLMLAMDSRDPIVRGVAIKRQAMQREMETLDRLLTLYADVAPTIQVDDGLVALAKAAPAPSDVRRSKAPEQVATPFTDTIRTILAEHGGVMTLIALRRGYVDRCGVDATFARKLRRRTDLFPQDGGKVRLAPERVNGADLATH